MLAYWAIDCGEQGLVGKSLRIDDLGPAKIDTLVRIELADGRQIQRVLRRSEPSMIVPERATRFGVFRDYLAIGFEHILGGADHLLFVFGLFLLCSGFVPLAKTVTAFTVGHSITLSLAALGYAQLPSGPIEVLIAASVLALAVDLARDADRPTWMRRFPWPMALLFGLLHGLGFAGALREVGLPDGEIPMALFSFNVGIELGQLAFVALVLAARALVAPRVAAAPGWMLRAPVTAMGALAAYWCLDRTAGLF
jgi:hydrogenase/urease accessory protein HupE